MAQEIDHADPTERRRTVLAHHIGITVFSLLLLAALAGLLGHGPLSHAGADSADHSLHLEYHRFVRYEAPERLDIRIAPELTRDGEVEFQLSRGFVEKVEIERIEPEPVSTAIGPDYFTYRIRTETNRPGSIRVRFMPQHFGKLNYEVGLVAGPSVRAEHLAYP